MALGTEIPVIFCNDEEVAAKLHAISGGVFDQVTPPPPPPPSPPSLSVAIKLTIVSFGLVGVSCRIIDPVVTSVFFWVSIIFLLFVFALSYGCVPMAANSWYGERKHACCVTLQPATPPGI